MLVSSPGRVLLGLALLAAALIGAAWLASGVGGSGPGRARGRFVPFPAGGDVTRTVPREATPPGTTGAPTIRLTAVGDSVMLAAADLLGERFPGAVIDAAVGRTVPEALAVMRQWAEEGRLGDTVLVHIGNNGVFAADEFDEFVALAGSGRRLVFVNLAVPADWEEENNRVIAAGAARHGGLPVVDWHAAAGARPELLWDDGVHLRPEGAVFYVELLVPYLER